MARAVADKMSAALGQQVVVENRAAGGSGTVASRAVARGPADGYTLLLAYTTTLATAPHILPDVGYDVRKDFAPIGLIGFAPALLLVNPGATYRNVGDLIAAMKASKEPFQVGVPSVGSVNHLAAVLFAEQASVKLQYIPYKGSQPLNTDLIGGFVKVGFNPIPVSRAAIEGKLIRALAATSLKRSATYPGLADGRGIRPARLRRGAELRHRRAGRHAAADRRQAQQGAARGAGHRRGEETARPGRRRAGADHAGATRRRHRPRGKEMGGDDQVGRHPGEMRRLRLTALAKPALLLSGTHRRRDRFRRRTIRAGRSRWWCPTRPAAATT